MVGAFISLRRSVTLLRLKELSEYVPFQMRGVCLTLFQLKK